MQSCHNVVYNVSVPVPHMIFVLTCFCMCMYAHMPAVMYSSMPTYLHSESKRKTN